LTGADSQAKRQAHLWDIWAATYDAWHASNDPDAAVDFLLSQASDGRILELGIGTGRIALAIAARGRPVEGIDVSEAMLGQLRTKIGNLPVLARHGDMADIDVDGPFSLIYSSSSSFFHLTDQQRQVDCFRNVSAKLSADGRFVIEAFIPQPEMLHPARSITLRDFTPDTLRFSATVANRLTQQLQFQEVIMTPSGNEFLPVEERFCWPSELELMAQLAGMELAERYATYSKNPLNHRSAQHVSVYRKG
jgi:SAM-dependent methyltransferase